MFVGARDGMKDLKHTWQEGSMFLLRPLFSRAEVKIREGTCLKPHS